MSEFKFACPVCGQHMMCDASQGGSVMDCPTCFQKIVAPQAPAPDAKFILTGTKLSEKKVHVRTEAGATVAAPEKKFPWVLVIALVLCIAGTAAAIVFRGKIFGSKPPAPTNEVVNAPKPKPPEPPAPVAPKASDANWSLDLSTNTMPDSPVAGRIHGQDFLVERANYSTNGTLTLRAGSRGPLEFGLQISFSGAPAEALSGQTFTIKPDMDKAEKITLRWKDETGTVKKADVDKGYAMRLDFGPQARDHLPGKIWLCLPDEEKSYVLGTFNATVSRPKKK